MQRITSLIVFLFISGIPITAEEIVLESKKTQYRLNDSLEYYIDTRAEMTADDVIKKKKDYKPFSGGVSQIPRSGVMWLFFRLKNSSGTAAWIIKNDMNVELMELYLRESGAWRLMQRSGNSVPFTERSLRTLYPAFELDIPSGSRRDVLIRVFDLQSSSVQLSLLAGDRFSNDYAEHTLFLGLAFGFFAALIIYNLIVFIFNKERTYLLYALYMTAFFFNQFAQERLFSLYIQAGQAYGFFWFILFGSATAALGVEFFRVFIRTGEKMPRLDIAMQVVRSLAVLLGLSSFFYAGPVSADILNIISLAAMALIMTVLIIRIIKRDLLALVCLLGSLLYVAGTAAEILVTLLPFGVSPFIMDGQLYGALAQVLFLGFAVGAQTYRLRKNYEKMQLHFQRELKEKICERTAELEAANRKLSEVAVTDALTGLYNRGELERRKKELNTYLERKGYGREDYVISAAYLDLDNFKYCNDTFGHDYGDRLLKRTAGLLRENTRGYDLLFRLGGDEFLIIMPETDISKARGIVERIRSAIAGCSEDAAALSVSIGLSSSEQKEGMHMDELITAADDALLRSKEEGKNRISQ